MDRQAQRDLDDARRAVALARRRGARFAEVRLITGGSVGLAVQDGRAERMGAGEVRGSCVRLIAGGRWGFASTDGGGLRRLSDCVAKALELARRGRKLGRPAAVAPRGRKRGGARGSGPLVDGEDLAADGRIGPGELSAWAARVLELERAARKHAGRPAVNSVGTFGSQGGRVVVASSRGTAAVRWGRRMTASLMVVVSDGKRGIQRWSERVGRTGGDDLLSRLHPDEFSRRAAERALAVLRARPAPGGTFPVILDPATGGVFVHECLGHNAEADLVLSGQSLLDGKMGKRLASKHVTVVDDPTVPGAFGSYAFDSEGTPAERTEVISRGVLKSYLHSMETAARMKARPNG
ncbi:MAG: TldD/PmbA family protein, partial [Planctomycetota bacterium]